MKADPTMRDSPLVVMSGSNSARDIARARAAGVEYRVKPATFSGVCALMCDLVAHDCRDGRRLHLG